MQRSIFSTALHTAILAPVLFILSAVGPLPTSFAQEDAPKTKSAPAKTEAPIDFEKARDLLQKLRGGEKLTPEESTYLDRARAARRDGKRPPTDRPAVAPKESTGFKPLDSMSAEDRYQDQDGGLYGGGKNTPPDEHARAAQAALARVQPLDAQGKPSPDGRIVFISISMSNATQEFSSFKKIADADPAKSSKLTIVDCALGGQAMAEWAPKDARPWTVAEQRLQNAQVAPAQVQVAWIKLANKSPSGSLAQHGRKLQQDTQAVIRNAQARFPNLRLVYFSSRTYGGYAGNSLNPEPYAYESAYVCRWLILDQIASLKERPAASPILLWGPYLWADGVNPRPSDSLVWRRDHFGPDGVHPSTSGRDQVARLLLTFFRDNPLSQPWFTGKPVAPSK